MNTETETAQNIATQIESYLMTPQYDKSEIKDIGELVVKTCKEFESLTEEEVANLSYATATFLSDNERFQPKQHLEELFEKISQNILNQGFDSDVILLKIQNAFSVLEGEIKSTQGFESKRFNNLIDKVIASDNLDEINGLISATYLEK